MERAATAPSPPSHLPQPSTSTGITSQGSKKKARRQVARKIATQFLPATPHSEESDVETSQSVEFQEALAYQGCHTEPPVQQVARKSASPRHKAPLETHKPHIPASYARGHREHLPPSKQRTYYSYSCGRDRSRSPTTNRYRTRSRSPHYTHIRQKTQA